MPGSPLAYGLAFGAAFIWAGYSVMTRRYGQGAKGVPLFLPATATVLWNKYLAGDAAPLHLNYPGLAQVLLGALTASAHSCWTFGVRHASLTVLANTSYFTPVLSATLASLWLGITPEPSLPYGVAMVTAGYLLCLWATSQKNCQRGQPLLPR